MAIGAKKKNTATTAKTGGNLYSSKDDTKSKPSNPKITSVNTTNAEKQLADNEDYGEKVADTAPKIDDINETSSTMDINANEHHPRNFLSTAKQMADEVDFEEGVEGSEPKADNKARRTARKEILDDVKELHKDSYDKLNAEREKWNENQETLKALDEQENAARTNASNLKKETKAEYRTAKAEAKKIEDKKERKETLKGLKKQYKEDKKTIKDDLDREMMYNKIQRSSSKGTPNAAQIGIESAKASLDFVSRNEELINEIDRISKLPDGEEKENAIKALEEKYGNAVQETIDEQAMNEYNENLKKYNAAEKRALQGALYDTLYSNNEEEKIAAQNLLGSLGLDGKSPEELKQLLDQVKKENDEFFSENGNDDFYKNLNSQTAANEYIFNNEKPVEPEPIKNSPIRGMLDRYINNYQTTFDEEKEKSRLGKIKTNKNLYKGYLIWTNLMSKIQEASHNFANPNDRIEASDAISQRQGQDISNMIDNRNKKNKEYIDEQINYLKDTLGVDIETAKLANILKNSRIRNDYKRLTDENKTLLAALTTADTFDTLKDYQILDLIEKLKKGEITTTPQLASVLSGYGMAGVDAEIAASNAASILSAAVTGAFKGFKEALIGKPQRYE